MFRNRIINGGMVIDQRNAGASVTPLNGAYTLDRWTCITGGVASKYSVQQNAGAVTTPTGFTNYLGVTSLSAYAITSTDRFGVAQYIEGFNSADLGFGTANASTVTVSFLVYSSLTGTFGGSLQNYLGTRSYPFSYSIPVANTWTKISITIAGDTSGTWVGASNSGSITLIFSTGAGSTYSGTSGAWASADYRTATGAVSVVGTSGATFYITGVQLEKGSLATSFDYRPYGTELQLCQRYYEIGEQRSRIDPFPSATIASAFFAATKRATPTITGTATLGTISLSGANGVNGAWFNFTSGASGNFANSWTASAEL
jgi:hypothetical protein